MQQEQQQLHSAIKPLSWLIGKWFGKEGNCHYPTIKSIKYNEELLITHPASNQPMLHLNFKSWIQTENGEKKYLHFESGFLKVKPDSSPLMLTYTSSHNNGLTLIEEGFLDDLNKKITLESINVSRISISKPPSVLETKKEFLLTDELLTCRMFMSTSTNPVLTEHLVIKYEKL